MTTKASLLTQLKFELFESDYGGMWTPDYLTRKLNEAQYRFCEDTGLFVDRATYVVNVAAGTQDYPLDPKIIRVLDARISGSSCPLMQLSYEEFVAYVADDTTYVGTPTVFTTEAAMGTFSVPTPSADVTIRLRVHRYALHEIDDTHGSETPAQFDRALIHYAAAEALLKHDAELSDPVKSAEHRSIYREEVIRARQYVNNVMGTHLALEVNPSYVV